MAENTGPSTDVGAPVAATDRDGDTLTYTLEGDGRGRRSIYLSTSGGGQIRTSAALNHEEKASYAVTVRVRDGRGGTDAVNLTIRVTDVDNEAPDTPFAPTVTAVSSTRLQVTWEMPANHRSSHHRLRLPVQGAGRVLDRGDEHDDHGDGGDDRGPGGEHVLRRGGAGDERGGHERLVESGHRGDERTRGQQPARLHRGRECDAQRERKRARRARPSAMPVAAKDADSGDTLTYDLEGRDAGLFDINTSSGQLLTRIRRHA